MERLIIVGAGGCGREVAGMVRHMNRQLPEWELAGFLDDAPQLQGQQVGGLPVLGPVEAAGDHRDARFVCCVLEPLAKLAIVERLRRLGARWATLIHPSAIVMAGVQIGEGSVICPFCAVSTEVTVGRHVYLNYYSSVGHNSTLGDYAALGPHAVVTGKSVIGEGVFIGAGACVLPAVDVGAHTMVGGAAVVNRSIPPASVAVGVPAHVIKRRALNGPSGAAAAKAA